MEESIPFCYNETERFVPFRGGERVAHRERRTKCTKIVLRSCRVPAAHAAQAAAPAVGRRRGAGLVYVRSRKPRPSDLTKGVLHGRFEFRRRGADSNAGRRGDPAVPHRHPADRYRRSQRPAGPHALAERTTRYWLEPGRSRRLSERIGGVLGRWVRLART